MLAVVCPTSTPSISPWALYNSSKMSHFLQGGGPAVHQLLEEHAVQEAREEVLGVLNRDIGAPETEEGRFVEADEGFRVYPDQSQARSVAL